MAYVTSGSWASLLNHYILLKIYNLWIIMSGRKLMEILPLVNFTIMFYTQFIILIIKSPLKPTTYICIWESVLNGISWLSAILYFWCALCIFKLFVLQSNSYTSVRGMMSSIMLNICTHIFSISMSYGDLWSRQSDLLSSDRRYSWLTTSSIQWRRASRMHDDSFLTIEFFSIIIASRRGWSSPNQSI